MNAARAQAVLEEKRRRDRLESLTLEDVVTGADFAALPASKLQVAIARAADGRDLADVLDSSELREYFGVESLEIAEAVSLVVLVCGVRSGKSFLAACAAIKGCLTADLSALKQHEMPRFAIVAPTVDNANATFVILAGIVRESRVLRALVVKETSGEMRLRRADGRVVEIVVVAAHRGAITLRSRWLIGFVLEEVALFGEMAAGAVVTGEELLRAGETRLVPGSQGWIISSPFGPTGLLWDLHRLHFGSPGRVLVVHAPTVAMNTAFDPAMVDAIRARDPDAAAREYDARWLDASSSLLSATSVDRCTRAAPETLPFEAGHYYSAAMDPATRGNSWTLVIGTRKRFLTGAEKVVKDVIVRACQWTGSKSDPLDPEVVLREMAVELRAYGLTEVWSDDYGTDFVRKLAYNAGIDLHQEKLSAVEGAKALELRVESNTIEFPPGNIDMRADLIAVKKIARQGSVQIVLPKTANGRHGDYIPSIFMQQHKRPQDPDHEAVSTDVGELAMFAEMDRRDASRSGRNPHGTRVDQAPRGGTGRFGR